MVLAKNSSYDTNQAFCLGVPTQHKTDSSVAIVSMLILPNPKFWIKKEDRHPITMFKPPTDKISKKLHLVVPTLHKDDLSSTINTMFIHTWPNF